jgi:hypothetical protein
VLEGSSEVGDDVMEWHEELALEAHVGKHFQPRVRVY